MLATLVLHRGAEDDLVDLYADEPRAAGVIYALLQQLKADPKLLETLTSQGFGENGNRWTYSVLRLVGLQRTGRNIWRLKSWPLERMGLQYRVIYGFDHRKNRFYVLGILHRDFAYDEKHPKVQRMVAAYDRLEIPPIP